MTSLTGTGPVVIVDDDELDVEVLSTYYSLSELNGARELVTFADGPSFLDHMGLVEIGREAIPSVIMLDINMPMMNGFDVLTALRDHSRFADVPAVMFLSNTDSPADIERCTALGARFQEKFDNGQDCIGFFNSLIGSGDAAASP